jgi:site-specific DNA-methyltransferase (adenine-specific)
MQQDGHFPPVTVFYDGREYWLADGFHRVAAAQNIGKDRILADVQQGRQRDAILYSVGANARHGLPRSNEDKRRAVLKLLNDTEWRQWSDREIARRCVVTANFVGDVRRSLSSDYSENSADASHRTYITRHGTPATMQTNNIGATVYASIPQLEQGLVAWLNRQTADRTGQIALLIAIQERTTRGLLALDDLLATPELAAPRRKGDVQQAVNNTLAQMRQAEAMGQDAHKAGDRDQGQGSGDRSRDADGAGSGLVPVSWSLAPAPQLAIFTQVQAGVTSWLAENYPGDGREVLQAIVEGTPEGLDHQRSIFRSGHLPDPCHPSDVPAACANLLAQAEAVAEALPSTFTLPSASTSVGQVTVICADSRQLAAHLAPCSAHLVVTSPPYNVGIAYGAHDDNQTDAEYLALLRAVVAQCHGVLVNGGRIAVVAPHGVGRLPWRPLAAHIAAILADLGFTLRGQIIWSKQSTGNRTTWGSWESSNNPTLRDTTEAIIVAHKGRADLAGPQPLPVDWLPGELFMALTQDLWAVRAETHNVGHPAPFPVELVERLIRLYAFPGAHIVDPFGGSGTVGVAAVHLGCQATLVDVDAAYCELAVQRLRREQISSAGAVTQ